MKKFLKKASIILLALFTLVSCSKYNADKSFEYDTFEELSNALENSVIFDETNKTGIYSVDINSTKLKGFEVKYTLHTRLWKDDTAKSSKDNPYISPDNLVLELKLTKKFDNDTEEYLVLSKHCFEKDFYTESLESEDNQDRLEITKHKKVYKKIKNCLLVSTQGQELIYVTSNESNESLMKITKEILLNLEFLKFGKSK